MKGFTKQTMILCAAGSRSINFHTRVLSNNTFEV